MFLSLPGSPRHSATPNFFQQQALNQGFSSLRNRLPLRMLGNLPTAIPAFVVLLAVTGTAVFVDGVGAAGGALQ
jgi:hypothetical protein